MTGTCCGSPTQHCGSVVFTAEITAHKGTQRKTMKEGCEKQAFIMFFYELYRERFPSNMLLDQFKLVLTGTCACVSFFKSIYRLVVKTGTFLFSSLDVDSNIVSMRALILDRPVPMPALSVLFITSLASNGLWVCLSNSWSAVSLTCSWERANTHPASNGCNVSPQGLRKCWPALTPLFCWWHML